MEEVRSNGRNPFQWKKFIPMEEVHSIGGDGSYKTSSVEDKDYTGESVGSISAVSW